MTKFNKIFPWYAGLSCDLLFWVAIDTLFLTVVKNFNASQIVSLTTVSLIACIALQVPILRIIKKIENTNSVRLGSMLLLVSSLLLTFGQNYIVIALGKVIYEIAFTFQNMANAVLKNNLELQDRNNEYIKVKTKSNTIYATVTMIILFIRDPFKVYMQDLALRKVGKEGQQSLLTTMELSRKIGRAIISLSFTMILVNNPMITVIAILFVLSIIEILVSIKLYKLVINGKEVKSGESSNRNCEQTLC